MKNNKKYVLHISGLGENSKYSYPRIDRLSYSKFEKKNKEAIALGLVTEINQKYNKHLYKILKKINKAQSQINIKAVFIKTDLLDKTIDLLFKGSLYSFKIHTASSYFYYKFGYVFSGNEQFPPLFCTGAFDGPKRASTYYSQFGAFEIKLPKDALYTEQTSVSHFDASKEGSQPERVWQIATNPVPILAKFMDDLAKEKTIVSESKEKVDDFVSEYLDNTEYDIVIDNIKKSISKKYMSEKIAGKHNIRLPKDFKQRVFDLSFLIDIDNKLETSPFIGIIQQELLLSRGDKEMIGDLDTLTFEQLVELFTVLASMKGMVKVLNKDTNEWILAPHEEKLSLCSEICNVVNNDANSMLEESKFDDAIDKTRIEPEKPKLTCNGIHLADIESIKIEKYGVLLIRLDVEEGYFGKDSRKCRWDLYQDIDEAVDVLRKYHGTPKVYSRLKYTSNSSKLFSNVIPEVSKKSFGKIFKVLIDVDSLFYIARTWNMDAIECKKIEYLEQHNAKVTNKELHSAIEILDSDIESKYTIEPHIAIPQVEEIKTSCTMAAIKDGQYLFIDDSTFKMGEDRSATFNSILRAEGYKEEIFCVLYKNLDKVRFNYYIDAANVKDKTISAVYVSSSYSDYNKNIVLREHQKADIEDIKLDIKMEKEENNKPEEDEVLKCSEAYKFKNDFAGTGNISAIEPTEEIRRMIDGNPTKYRLILENNSRRQSAKGNKTVLVIIPSADNDFDIIRKTKMELESDEKLSNYRTKFISTSSNLFVLIKNHLLSMAESDNYALTKEQISSVDKIYVPSDAIGLYYKTIKDKEKHRLAIVFSYNQENYIERVNDFIAKIHDFTKAELLAE